MKLAAAAGLAAYGLGGSVVMALSNDYLVLLAMQGITVATLVLLAMHRSSAYLSTWIGVLGVSLLGRLISVAITRGSAANKTAKFRRWDALVTTVGYAAAMGYLMTSVIPGRSVTRYLELTAVGIPSVTAASMALFDARDNTPADSLGQYAALSSQAYTEYTIHDPDTDTRVMIAGNVVAFAGTDSKKNVLTDLRMNDMAFEACGARHTRVHAGFLRAWTSVRERVIAALPADGPIACVGHSLGGALAVLAALDITCTLQKTCTVATFGAPQVGDEMFADEFNARVSSIRVVNPLDPVPRSLSSQFAHVAGVYYVSVPTLDPHDIEGYEAAVSHSRAMRVVGLALPVLYVVRIYLAMQKPVPRAARR